MLLLALRRCAAAAALRRPAGWPARRSTWRGSRRHCGQAVSSASLLWRPSSRSLAGGCTCSALHVPPPPLWNNNNVRRVVATRPRTKGLSNRCLIVLGRSGHFAGHEPLTFILFLFGLCFGTGQWVVRGLDEGLFASARACFACMYHHTRQSALGLTGAPAQVLRLCEKGGYLH